MPRRTTSEDYYHGGPLAPSPMCVRCGRHPRAHETFLCVVCLRDPVTRREMIAIERSAQDHQAQRRVAIETFHWAGGWGRRT